MNKRILFVQPHKTVVTEDIDRKASSLFLSEVTDSFARVVPSIPAMTILGALPEYERFFIDATAENPTHIFSYNDRISLLGAGDEELLDTVSELEPHVILMTSMFTTEYFSVNRLIRLLKKNFTIPVVVGGHHATLRPEWHMEAGADAIIYGEGENTIRDLLSSNRNVYRQGVASLDGAWDIETVLKRSDGTNRYPLSLVTRNPELYLPQGIDVEKSAGVLYASRGCPFHCQYCNATERDGHKIRHMSLERMVSLTEEFLSLGVTTFHNEADTFGMHPVDREFCRWVAKQRTIGRSINLVNTNSFFARYFFIEGEFSTERVDLLRDAGFKTITISIESFNPEYNNGKLEGITLPLLQECFAYIKSQGLTLEAYMMYLFSGYL
jgi:radical SAM superfamily enzyme YgiQ (UPF0313 family)